MDDLPDLQSDADVDALMARLRSQLAAASPPPPRSGQPPPPQTEESHDRQDLEVELASLVARAMQVVSDTLDDLEIGEPAVRAMPARHTRSTRSRQMRTRRKTR